MELIHWGRDARQRVSYDVVDQTNEHWLVVIHGGAWRDPKITDANAHRLLNRVKSHSPGSFGGLASCDYRLSPEVKDPAHMQDCLDGIAALKREHTITQITLVGHSCGAFLAGQIALHLSVRQIVGVEGIYDLQELVDEYPSYAGFVGEAFGTNWPQIPWEKLPLAYVVQSPDDELLSMRQSLRRGNLVLASGKHDEVFESKVEWVDAIQW